MAGVIFGSVFVMLAIFLAPIDTVSAIFCIFGAICCIPIIWFELK